jgi:amino acid transporter
MVFSEIAGIYPKRGLTAVIPTISHNKFYGFPFAIANWLGIVAVIALEATASIEYLIELYPEYESIFFKDHQLTTYGSMLAVVIIMFYSLLNFWGIKFLARANNIIVVFKLVVPLLTAILLLLTAFHAGNFTSVKGEFFIGGVDGVISAVLLGGLIVAFNGGQTIISYATELENPGRTIPLSITISIVFTLFIYLMLQISFIGAIPPDMLKNGWGSLNFEAPMVQLTGLVGLHFMMMILYTDAMVSPMGTAISFLGASTRMTTAMSRKKQMPSYFSKVEADVGVSRRSLFFNIGLAITFLFAFKSWAGLAQMLGLIHIVSYLAIPVALVVFRKNVPREQYDFWLPIGNFIAWFLFVFFTYLFSMASPKIALEMILVLAVFQVIFVFVNAAGDKEELFEGFKLSLPIYLFFVLLLGFNYISPNNDAKVMGQIPFILILTIFSSISFYLFQKYHVSDTIVDELESVKNES